MSFDFSETYSKTSHFSHVHTFLTMSNPVRFFLHQHLCSESEYLISEEINQSIEMSLHCLLRSRCHVSCRPSGDGEVGRRPPTLSRANRGSGCPSLPHRPLPRGRRLPPPSVRSVASRLREEVGPPECPSCVSFDRVLRPAGQHQPPQTELLRVQRQRSAAVRHLQRSQAEESGRGQ